jgi:ATP-dependent helicase/nuclease subunit A
LTHARHDPSLDQRKAAHPKTSAWVSASAGTGKTKVLTDRVLTLLLDGTPPHKILCLTFTKAAAAEMANRIADKLKDWATLPDPALDAKLLDLLGAPADPNQTRLARRLFAQVLDVPGGMKIQTIHAFCQSLLRRFPLEAGLAPHFQVMDDRDAAELLELARDEVLAAARDAADPALAEALSEVVRWVGETGFPDLLADLTAERGRIKRMVGAPLRARLGLADDDSPAGIVARACDDQSFAPDALRGAVAILQGGSVTDTRRAEAIAGWLADPDGRATGFDGYKLAYLTAEGEIRKSLATKKCAAALPALEAEAERILRVARRHKSAVVVQATEALLRLGLALLAAYEHHKDARALLDYDDLILGTVRLLTANPGAAAWVLFKLDGGIDHLLVDEAQDTNPDQWAVVRALTDEFFAGLGARGDAIRTVFAVGDAKQSIYSFQRADPREFERMRGILEQLVPSAGQRWAEIPLRVSFRSTTAVLDAVDAVFNRDPGRDGVALDGEEIRHVPWRAEDAGLVEIWPPVEPKDTDDVEPWKPPVERVRGDSPRARLAGLMARRIRAMVGSETLESKGRPVRAGDVMVLVRRRNAFVEDLVRELKAQGVAVAGADRLVLTEQMAVMDLMALGHALLLPEDDLTLATVLKGPLIGLDEEQLFRLARPRTGTLWQALRQSEEFRDAHDALTRLLGLADRVPPHEFFAHVLGALGGRLKLVRRLGWEAEDALDEFMALTLAYERAHPPSLQGFLHWLESGAVEIKRDLEQGGHDAVRIMTVHGSKGLQAPIVFLPDTLQAPSQVPRLLWLGEREAETLAWLPRSELADEACVAAVQASKQARDQEYRRLLYVAMTRAEDRLYVCGWRTRRTEPVDCWYNLMRGAVAGIGVETTDDFLAGQRETAHARVLRVTCAQRRPPPPSRDTILAAAEQPWPAWIHTPAPGEPEPPRPLAPSRPDGDEPPVRSPLGTDDGARYRRGVLIHRLLQTLPDLPAAKRSQAAARFLARPAWNLPSAVQAELGMEVMRVLNDPAFAAIFGPGSQAEVPIVGVIGDRAISAQVDRLLVTDDEVLVVDYKTNRPPPSLVTEVAPVYLRQMAAYRAALACIFPNRPVRCALLWTDTPRLMPLDGRMLDDVLAGMAGNSAD